MARKLKIDYDQEHDILWLHDGRKVKDSLEMDNYIIDFANDSSIGGMEILNASKVLNRLSPLQIGKKAVSSIKSAVLKTYKEKELLYMVFLIKIVVNNEIRDIPIQLNAPKEVMLVRN